MLTYELQGQSRTELGKTQAKLDRANGLVPCIIYGGEKEVHFTANVIDFEKVYITPNVYAVKIVVDGATYTAIVKEIQFHPVTDIPMHADFLEVTESKVFSVKLPVNFVGTSAGVLQGGKLQAKMRKIRVRGLLKDMPEVLDVDISNTNIGQSVKVTTLSYDNLVIEEPKNAVVCSVNLTRAASKAANLAKEAAKK